MSMPFNLPHHVRHIALPKSRALLPLFEAIVNSIQAVNERPGAGTIRLIVKRDTSQMELIPAIETIQSFTIIDDGIGFTERHFQSFSMANSDHRAALGGKGVGRFLWLKAFDIARVESTFDDGTSFRTRKFTFSTDDEGIHPQPLESAASNKHLTVVVLEGFKAPYRDGAKHSISTLAHKILQHCMFYFLNPDGPRLIIEDGAEKLDVATVFEQEVTARSRRRQFMVNGFPFEITNFCISNRSEHLAHLCVDDREVTDFSLTQLIPELSTGRLRVDGYPFAIASYIGGAFLDAAGNRERTDFVFDDETTVWEGLSRKDLRVAIADEVRRDFVDEIEAVAHSNIVALRDFIDDHPEFRVLNSHPEELLAIPSATQPEKLRVELYKATNRLREKIRETGRKLLDLEFDNLEETDEYKAKFSNFVRDLNEMGKSELANYVVHRKVVLEILGKAIRRGESGKYPVEEAIHQLIFPLKATSNDVELKQQNLWILDERFAFHKYLTSDLPLNSVEDADFDSEKRPDLLIFNKRHILSEDLYPIQSIVLVEFKRAMRKDYDHDDNPVAQVFKYMRKIRAGSVTTTDGRPIDIKDSTPFYVYIICDLTKKARDLAGDYGFKPTPDGLGMFHLHDTPEIKAYMEIVPLQKVIRDAEKRNKILFDTLILP